MGRLVRMFWIIAGTLAVALAIVGMFVPILPTTPFLLLAAFCYMRGSGRFHYWLLHNRHFGVYFDNYYKGRGVPLRAKIVGIAVLWLTIGIAAVYVVPVWWGKLGLALIAAGVTLHLARMKTCRPEDSQAAPAHPLPAGEPECE